MLSIRDSQTLQGDDAALSDAQQFLAAAESPSARPDRRSA
jgi:hypothetical protein